MHTSRRNFLRYSALAATAGPIAVRPLLAQAQVAEHQATAQSTAKPSPIQLGMCSYTFRNFERARVISFMKDLNLTNLNAKDTKDHLPMTPLEATRQALDDYSAAGIRVTSVGAVYFQKDEDDDIRIKFEYAKHAGVKVIVAGDPSPQTLPRMEKFVKEYDIRIAIHNHGPEDKIWPSPLNVLKAVQNLDPRIGCCIDVGHCERAGTDVVTAIHAAGPRLFDMHMKDLTDFTAKESQVAVGDGKMPVHAIFEALFAIKYKGFVDLEYEIHGDDPMPGATKSFAYMRGVLAGMGYIG